MSIKRLIGSVAVAGIVGASTLGIGEGIANASTDQSSSGTAVAQPAGWQGHGYGHGWGHGYGQWGGWPGYRWHPWGWGWHRW
jgi:hypothetical protein